MSDRRELATVSTYSDLVAALRARTEELELSRLGLDAVSGIASGHSSKLFCGTRGFGAISLFAVLDGLGLSLVVVEDPAKVESAQRARARLGIGKRIAAMVRQRGRRAAPISADTEIALPGPPAAFVGGDNGGEQVAPEAFG